MRPKTILLVEDHDDSRFICGAILRHNGYGIVEAADGATGVELARTHHPDLIVMDVSLPVLDGWTATERIRETPVLANVPIIALTAHALRADRDRGREAGFAAYLIKPCSPMSVLEEVRRLIGPPFGDPPA